MEIRNRRQTLFRQLFFFFKFNSDSPITSMSQFINGHAVVCCFSYPSKCHSYVTIRNFLKFKIKKTGQFHTQIQYFNTSKIIIIIIVSFFPHLDCSLMFPTIIFVTGIFIRSKI